MFSNAFGTRRQYMVLVCWIWILPCDALVGQMESKIMVSMLVK